jgi:hypothetical protein
MILKIYKKNYVSFLKKLLRVEILFLFCEILAIVDIDVFSLGKMKLLVIFYAIVFQFVSCGFNFEETTRPSHLDDWVSHDPKKNRT